MGRVDVELRREVEQALRLRVERVVTYAKREDARQIASTVRRTCRTVRCSKTSRQITRS